MSESTDQRGFSMIELLVAMSILLVGTLAVASMLMKSSDNSISSNRARTSDVTALELMEALKAELAQIQFANLTTLRLQRLVPGSTTRYEYQDDPAASTGTETTEPRRLNYVQRLGKGNGYVYRWRVGIVTNNTLSSESSPPTRRLMTEVIVGWNDKKADPVKSPCDSDPNLCQRRSRITNWIIEPESKL